MRPILLIPALVSPALLSMALLAAACGSATTETTTVAPPTAPPVADYPLPTGPTDIVLRLSIGANQPDPLPIVAVFPELTLYGDGRLLVADPARPRPVLPQLIEVQLTAAGAQRLVAEADARGALDPLDRYGTTALADGDSTRFTIDSGDGQAQFSVYDLGGESFAEDLLTSEQLDARRQLVELRDGLRSWRDLVGDEILSEGVYVPEAVAVVGIERGDAGNTDLPVDLGSSGERLETRIVPVQCLIVTGSERDELVDALEQADATTDWRLDGRGWDVVFRPLLPEETGCASLADQ